MTTLAYKKYVEASTNPAVMNALSQHYNGDSAVVLNVTRASAKVHYATVVVGDQSLQWVKVWHSGWGFRITTIDEINMVDLGSEIGLGEYFR